MWTEKFYPFSGAITPFSNLSSFGRNLDVTFKGVGSLGMVFVKQVQIFYIFAVPRLFRTNKEPV